jgi:hypothetical protein
LTENLIFLFENTVLWNFMARFAKIAPGEMRERMRLTFQETL